MDNLKFRDPERAAYTANRLFDFIHLLGHYAGEEPAADFQQANNKLAAIAEVCRHMLIDTIDKHTGMMISGYPEEAIENHSTGLGLDPRLAEQSIRRWRGAV